MILERHGRRIVADQQFGRQHDQKHCDHPQRAGCQPGRGIVGSGLGANAFRTMMNRLASRSAAVASMDSASDKGVTAERLCRTRDRRGTLRSHRGTDRRRARHDPHSVVPWLHRCDLMDGPQALEMQRRELPSCWIDNSNSLEDDSPGESIGSNRSAVIGLRGRTNRSTSAAPGAEVSGRRLESSSRRPFPYPNRPARTHAPTLEVRSREFVLACGRSNERGYDGDKEDSAPTAIAVRNPRRVLICPAGVAVAPGPVE